MAQFLILAGEGSQEAPRSPGMKASRAGFVPARSEGGPSYPSREELPFTSGNEMLGPEVDWSGVDDNFMALGLGVPPLPLWAHGEPAAMPALLFFAPRKPHAPNGALDAWSDMGGIGGIATL